MAFFVDTATLPCANNVVNSGIEVTQFLSLLGWKSWTVQQDTSKKSLIRVLHTTIKYYAIYMLANNTNFSA